MHRPSRSGGYPARQARRSPAQCQGLQYAHQHRGAGAARGCIARAARCARARATRQAQLGGRHRRARFLFAGFLQRHGLSMTKVPYRNPVEAANDLAEGRVHMYMSALAIVRPQLQAGKVKLLAGTNTVRAPAAPDVPTRKEAGYGRPTLHGLLGLFGPTRTPKQLRERIAADIRAGGATHPVIRERLYPTRP